MAGPSQAPRVRLASMTVRSQVLALIEELGEARSAEIAEHLGYTLPGAASTLLHIHRNGYLRRRRASMRREYVYTLSPKGERYLEFCRF